MAYQINRYNNSLLTSVEDGTLDRTTDLKFIGKNFAGYGEIQNENFLYLLENFASPSQPPRPISGQVWFDSSSNKLKFYDGAQFKTTGGAEISATQPTGLTEGDFWWNTADKQLYAFDGTDFVLVGPQSAPGAGATEMESVTVTDDQGVSRTIIKAVVDDAVVFIISNTEFVLGVSSAIPGFTTIKKGITLVNTDANGVSGSDYIHWGTASNSLKLNGLDASEYVLASNTEFTDINNPVAFQNIGIRIGEAGYIYVENQNQLVIENSIADIIKFKAKNQSGQIIHSTSVTSSGIVPAGGNINLGTNSSRWATVYANNVDGLASSASAIRLSGTDYQPSIGAANNTVALRDSDGDIVANEFRGVATSAQFADLAEVYSTDKDYPVGTVLAVGGEKECRAAKIGDFAVGVISLEPAYLMNSKAEGQAVALKGRVPVRVQGPVSKRQAVYVGNDGIATTIESRDIVGVALETNNGADEVLIECVLKV